MWENSTEFHRGSGSPKDQEKIQENAARPGKNTEELQRLVIRERERRDSARERETDREAERQIGRGREYHSFMIILFHGGIDTCMLHHNHSDATG